LSYRFSRLFAKLPWSGNSKVTFSVFESSCQLLHQSNHSKVEAIPVSALPKDTTSELLAYSDSTRKLNPGLLTTGQTL